eukprot:TRINITY_DN1186_c0_g2_i2.p1 TRINITY_DN1186_c0_g2~~TRINITY_DN1186_c0_g2_i2.p1  ORF type:complete len:1008 (+),score=311.69 TRINITY_DN1186_c0_g2_i2:336-3026(+)
MKHSLFPEFIRSEGHKLLQRTVSPSESLRGQSAPSSENSSGGSRIGQKLEYLRVMVGDDRKTILCSRELNAADCKEHIIEKLCREHNGALTPELFAKESSLYKTHALFREVPALKAYVELFASDIVIVMESGSEQPSAVSMQPSTRLDFLSRRSELAKGLKDAEADVSAAIREMSEAMDSHASSALKKALREKVDAKSALVQSLSQQLLNFPSPLEKSGFLSMIKGDSINKYYFTLEDGAFKYYESPGDSMAMGTVGLVVNETAVLFSPNNNQTFVVQTGTARTVFMTSTPEERLEWMQALSGNCERAIGELDASEAIALKKTTASRLRKSKASRKNSLLIPARRSPSDKGIKKVTERNISINEPLLKGFQSERVIGQDAVFKDAGEGALTLQAGRYEDVCTILWLFHDTNTVSLDLQSWLLMYHNYCTPEQFIDAVATSWQKVKGGNVMDTKVALNRLSSFVSQVLRGENLNSDSTARAKLRDGFTKLLEPEISNSSTLAKIKSESCKPFALIKIEAPQVIEGVKLSKAVMEHSTREIATAMTKIAVNFFRKVMPYEFVDCLWQKDEAQAPGVVALTAHYNKVVSWITHTVLQPQLAKDRLKTLKKYILVGKTLLEMKNYSSAFEIISALNQRSLTRLKSLKELEAVDKYREPLDALRTTFGFTSNFKEYRALSQSPPFLPVMAVHLRDVVFAHDGLTKWWGDDKSTGLVNFVRCTRVSQVIFRMGVHREVTTRSYTELPASTCDVMLEEALERTYPGEQELFNLSQQREPPAPKQVMTHEQLVDNVERFMTRFEAYTNDYEQRICALEREVTSLRRENRELRKHIGLRGDDDTNIPHTSSTVTDLSDQDASDSDLDHTPKRPKRTPPSVPGSPKPALPPLPDDYVSLSETDESE